MNCFITTLQKQMKFPEFLRTRLFLKNLFYALILITGLFAFILLALNIYTRHGQALEVPNLTGKTIDEVMKITKSNKIRFEISDSVFNSGFERGTVVEQYPIPGLKVKKRRTIFLVINAYFPEIISMPKVTEVMRRQAINILGNAGLFVDTLEFKHHYAFEYVLEQKFEGEIIQPGTQLPRGSSIVLVVGGGEADQKTMVPDLFGLVMDSARALSHSSNLNIGAIIYDESIIIDEDSVNALVWKQAPEYNKLLNLGSPIDIWLTVDSTKIFGSEEIDLEIFNDDKF